MTKNTREECHLSRESQHVPTAEGASGSNVEEEIRSVVCVGGRARVVYGITSNPIIQAFCMNILSVMHTLV